MRSTAIGRTAAIFISLSALPLNGQERTETAFKPEWVHFTAKADVRSAYHLYGAIFNDEPSWTCDGSVDFDLPWDFGTVGGEIWILSEITDRCKEYNTRWDKETDFNVHWFDRYSFNDDWRVNYGLLYIWFTYHHSHGENMATQRSVVFVTDLENPYATPFLSCEYQHAYSDGVMLQYGLKRPCSPFGRVPFTVTPSLYFTTASSGFFNGLFPTQEDGSGYGFGMGSVFAEVRADYPVFDWMNVWAKAVWMSVINPDIRDAISYYGGTYHNDYLVFEMGVDFTF